MAIEKTEIPLREIRINLPELGRDVDPFSVPAIRSMDVLSLVSLIKAMIEQNAQLIIATHSPMLMAISGAIIIDFDQEPPVTASFDSFEYVRLYRSFLECPEAFIQRL